MDPLISILIPCYNAEKWLRETLRSCLAQTWENIEVIVVDDGSKDRSYEVAQSFQVANLKVLRQPNQGASAARNRAYAEAQGEFIQHLDADDLLSPDKIEAQVRLLQANPPDMLAVSATKHFYDGQNPDNGKLHAGWPRVDSDDPLNWLIELLGPEQGSMVQPGAWLTPRSITEKIGPWDLSICPTPMDDGEYFARAVLASSGIRANEKGFNYYRQFRTGNSLSGQKSEAYRWGHFRSLGQIEKHLLARTSDGRAKKALARCFMDLAFSSYPAVPNVAAAALGKVKELGGAKPPAFGTPKGEMLARLFGGKAVRFANHHYHLVRKKIGPRPPV
jgi:glycosyltransferase involved in cell wall biosynthesis